MEKILNVIDRPFLENCLAGTPVDVGSFTDQQIRRAAVIMPHCCLNGPVGVNKVTTFPTGLQGTIKTLLDLPNMSNKSWQATCRPFAVALKAQYPEVCAKCQQNVMYRDIWPLHGNTGKANP